MHGLVDVGPGLQEDANDFDAPFAHGEEERREAGRQRGPEIGSGLEQHLDDRRMSIGGRPHQGGLPVPFLRIDVRAPGQQRLHGPELAGASGGHQGRLAAAQSPVRIGAGGEQQLDDRLRSHSRRPATAASRRSGSRP